MRRSTNSAEDKNAMPDIDPRLTEKCLQAQPEVVKASVWLEGNRLLALVTVLEGANISRRQLQSACRTELGAPYTPVSLDLIQAKRKAA